MLRSYLIRLSQHSVLVVALLLGLNAARAQSSGGATPILSRMKLETDLALVRIPRDTTLGTESSKVGLYVSSDSSVADTGVVFINERSALTAVLLSALLPSGGQVYNRSYWKVPIILGVQAFFLSQWISNNKEYRSFRSQYDSSLRASPPYGDITLQEYRDLYHDQRDSYAWYGAGVYLLSVLDAYIDAELSGYDISPSLGYSSNGSPSLAISVQLKF